jgi:hypothetical protein
VGTGIIWSKADLKLGAIDRGSSGCCDKCVEVAKPDFNKESFAQLEASASSGRADRCFWAFPRRFDPRSWT